VRIIIIILFVSLAYLIISEGKILRYIQFQKSPNKVGFLGLIPRPWFKIVDKRRCIDL